MGFLSNLANATPGLGTVKALVHYACGQEEEGDEALYQSTRNTLVLGGGIIGGPPGAVAAGLATDVVASASMGEEKGLIECCKNISEDIITKRNPTKSIVCTGLQMGIDALSGVGGSSGVKSATEVSKTMSRGAKQNILKSVKISGTEAAKWGLKQTSRRTAETAIPKAAGMYVHVGLTAAHKTALEREREQWKRERTRRWTESESEHTESERTPSEEREITWRWSEHTKSERTPSEEREITWRWPEHTESERTPSEERDATWRWQERTVSVRTLSEEKETWTWEEHIETVALIWAFGQREGEERKKQIEKERRAEKEYKQRQQRANSEKQNRDTCGSNSGSSQPPQGNKGNGEKRKRKAEPSIYETFMTLLIRILKIVYGNESEPFTSMFEKLRENKTDREYLIKILKPIRNSGTLEVVIQLVIKMFKEHFHDKDINFLNFISLLEFVQTYVTDELKERDLVSSGTETADTKMTPKERREKLISEIASEEGTVEKLIDLFEKLKRQIEAETATWSAEFPNFRDIFAAVYHYFKHRKTPHYGRIISIKEYYDWIKKYLGKLKQDLTLNKIKDSNTSDHVHEMYEPIFNRRFRIVLKFHDDKIALGSAYVVTPMLPADMEEHGILLIAQLLLAFNLLFYLPTVIWNVLMVLLNTSLIIYNCLAYGVMFMFSSVLFLFACFIFILKIFLSILTILMFIWFLFFYRPDQR